MCKRGLATKKGKSKLSTITYKTNGSTGVKNKTKGGAGVKSNTNVKSKTSGSAGDKTNGSAGDKRNTKDNIVAKHA